MHIIRGQIGCEGNREGIAQCSIISLQIRDCAVCQVARLSLMSTELRDRKLVLAST